MFSNKVLVLVCLLIFFNYGFAFRIQLECDSPIVKGATLNCTTSVFDSDNNLADGKFGYNWFDDAVPQNTRMISTGPSVDHWTAAYNHSTNTPGMYVIRVNVCKWEFLGIYCKDIDSVGTFFEITDSLSGKLVLRQSNETRNVFVSTSETLHSKVILKKSDADYIGKAPTVLAYWFVDCVYYGITTDFQFDHNFTKPEEDHLIETLVMGDFTPLPPPTTTPAPTTSTTTKPSTTTKSTTTTSKTPITKVTTTTPKPHNTTKASAKSKRDLTPNNSNSTAPNKTTSTNDTQAGIKIWQNGTLVPYNGTFPYVCNSTFVTTDNKKVYGYFHSSITTKAPVSNVTVSGNNWLQHGDLLSLNINCKGSAEMKYCVSYRKGVYNVTGNETCYRGYDDLEKCDFSLKRFFFDNDKHTVLIFIKNDVSEVITPVTVTVYKVKQQAQLSVIVVPVAFSLVAVVTIVFGIAYYLQNRSRFVVEVADFDFSQQYADMEYKTFKDRLKDSIVNAFTRDPSTSTSDAPVWPPGHKYGSMT